MSIDFNQLYELANNVYDRETNMSLNINVIAIAAQGSLKETAHSRILQQLLKKDEYILKSFLETIAKVPEGWIFSKDNVRPAEEERIDITIRNNQCCLIIENKVNNAPEQESQIFRYIEKMRAEGYSSSQIQVLYLNSDGHLLPSDYSLTNNGESDEFHKEVKVVVKDFKKDIYSWLSSLNIDGENTNLMTAIYQYKDYLKIKFHKMDEEIKESIKNTIFKGENCKSQNDKTVQNRLKKIEQAIVDTNSLWENLTKMKSDLIEERFVYLKGVIKEELKNYTDSPLVDVGEYDRCFGVKLNDCNCFVAFGLEKQNPYIGIYSGGEASPTNLNEIETALESVIGEKRQSTNYWPAYNYCELDKLESAYTKFLKELENSGLV